MESVRNLIVGAGISGLATAAFSPDRDCLVLEADGEIGGYCKTIKRSGFVWDYSGHFFHFKHPEIESWLRARMPGQTIRVVKKRSFISYRGRLVDFPFQKNIHQLPQDEFIDCLHDLFFAQSGRATEGNFKEMLYGRFGRSIAEKFLIPYNEKLYACDLSTLDRDAMGRFFPHADLADIIRNMKAPDNASYNATFSYPEGGAIEYVKALASAVEPGRISLGEPLLGLDLDRKIARTPRREIAFTRLVSSMPFDRLARLSGLAHDPAVFTWNKVLVFNLGFDRKGPAAPHWIYYPDRERVFYRIGFYDNIFDTDRMSLYVEIGFPRRRRRRPGRPARPRARGSAPRGPGDRSPARRRALGGDGPRLRAHHPRLDGRAAAPGRAAGRAQRALDRPLRRLDLLLDRGQHRRGPQAGLGLGLSPSSGMRRAVALRAPPPGRPRGAQSLRGSVADGCHGASDAATSAAAAESSSRAQEETLRCCGGWSSSPWFCGA
jgi:protoporphyrinogen oxidase